MAALLLKVPANSDPNHQLSPVEFEYPVWQAAVLHPDTPGVILDYYLRFNPERVCAPPHRECPIILIDGISYYYLALLRRGFKIVVEVETE